MHRLVEWFKRLFIDSPRPQTLALVYEVGGEFYEFIPGRRRWAHAVLFDDGTMWDARNGWRHHHTTETYIRRASGKFELWNIWRGWTGHLGREI